MLVDNTETAKWLCTRHQYHRKPYLTYKYLEITGGSNRPATAVSWNEAARFVNWLNTSKNLFPAYKIATGININWDIDLWDPILDPLDYDPSNRFRSKRATYVLPNADEWYKAAYDDPTTQSYYRYTTGSNSIPTPVPFGTNANTAVFGRQLDGPSDVHLAGGLSPYGVMGLGGNVYEWEETSGDPTNSNTGSYRIIRGGFWYDYYDFLPSLSSNRGGRLPGVEANEIGFRVATLDPSGSEVPEPSMMVIGTLFGLGGLVAKRRIEK